MTKRLSWLPAVAVAGSLAAPSAALAQAPRVEIGGGIGGLVVPGYGGTASPGTRVSVAINQRFAVESTFDRLNASSDEYGSRQEWTYAVQVKQVFRTGRQTGDGVFATYGAVGLIEHSHTNAIHYSFQNQSYDFPAQSKTDVSVPLFATAGVGFQQTLARYLAVRAEAGMAVGYAIVGRYSAGMSIPLGRGYRR
jgi:hypothetical protein